MDPMCQYSNAKARYETHGESVLFGLGLGILDMLIQRSEQVPNQRILSLIEPFCFLLS